jgi:hypothetical protein
MTTLREKHAAAPKAAPRKITIAVPGYEGDYYVRKLTVGERSRYEKSAIKATSIRGKVHQLVDPEQMRERLLALTLVNADGTRQYEETAEDMDFLASLPADVGEPLYEAARDHSGMSAEDDKELEELAGN